MMKEMKTKAIKEKICPRFARTVFFFFFFNATLKITMNVSRDTDYAYKFNKLTIKPSWLTALGCNLSIKKKRLKCFCLVIDAA